MDIRKITGFMLTAIGLLLLGVWKLFVLFIDLAGESESNEYESKEDPAISMDLKYSLDLRNPQSYDD